MNLCFVFFHQSVERILNLYPKLRKNQCSWDKVEDKNLTREEEEEEEDEEDEEKEEEEKEEEDEALLA